MAQAALKRPPDHTIKLNPIFYFTFLTIELISAVVSLNLDKL